MSPQPNTPFFDIITIPPLYWDMGMVVIAARFPTAMGFRCPLCSARHIGEVA
jgi:hypothetical protein